MAPKTRAEIQRQYRQRKKEEGNLKPKVRKSRAEIQKAYRERKKQSDSECFKNKENERKRRAYIPSAFLDRKAAEKRKEQNREKARRFRERRAAAKVKSSADNNLSNASTSHEQGDNTLIVKFNFDKSKRKRKRTSRAVARANYKIRKLENNNTTFQRKIWKLEKRIMKMQRSKAAATKKNENTPSQPACTTPRSRANAILRKAGMSPRTTPPLVKKRIVFAEAMAKEIESTSKGGSGHRSKTAQKGLTASCVAGKIIKKYRAISALSRATGLSRNLLSRCNEKLAYPKKSRERERQKQLDEEIKEFLERDDNSRMMPGKADFVTTSKGVKMQKRYLNDYLHNLHGKFLAENPSVVVSRASFCRRRPKHIIPTSFISRFTCLCQYHQNMALKLKGMKSCGAAISTNPDAFVKTDVGRIKEIIQQLPSKVKFSQWKRVEVEGKKKTKLLSFEETKKIFESNFNEDVEKFKGHVERIQAQYCSLKQLKGNLPANHVIVQMDFAENYSCQNTEEVQSAYWNPTMVTLHPAVTYFTNEEQKLTHRSRVFISDELGHNATAVYTILKKLVVEIKGERPSLSHIHYYTDSPTSQYRNKTIFFIISQHEKLFDVSASWNYFEAGHGKGPCDGVGGSLKRMADEAVRQQKVVIQDASDFFSWTKSEDMKDSAVSFTFYSKEECKASERDITQFGEIKPIPGTMKIHAIGSIKGHQGQIISRETSCYCQECFIDGCFNESSSCAWKKHILQDTRAPEKGSVKVAVDDWVAAEYVGKWYVGKVLKVDKVDRDAYITFLHHSSKLPDVLRQPPMADEIWVKFEDILAVIDPPFSCGKRNQFKINKETASMIEELHFNFLK